MTSTEPSPEPAGPDSALCEALATEHGVIYGYGMVSAYSSPQDNALVSAAIHQHRARRDRVVAILTDRSVTAPVAAAGYRLPMPLNGPGAAARLAVRMENDAATAWRVVAEQADDAADRELAVTALGESAVLAARWNRALDNRPITTAFPGGSE